MGTREREGWNHIDSIVGSLGMTCVETTKPADNSQHQLRPATSRHIPNTNSAREPASATPSPREPANNSQSPPKTASPEPPRAETEKVCWSNPSKLTGLIDLFNDCFVLVFCER